jgi:hypothetical protein
LPSFFPRSAPTSADTSGLTPAQKRLVDNYNKLVDQRTRLLQIVSSSFDEEAKKRALADIASLDKRIEQLQPQIDKIQGIGPTQDVVLPGSFTMAEIQAIAQAEGKSVQQVVDEAKRQGYTITDEPGAQPARRTLQGMSELVKRLKNRGGTWQQARIQVIKALVGRGYSPQEAARLADTQGKQLWDRTSVPKGEAPRGGVRLHSRLQALVNNSRIGQFVFRVTSTIGGKHVADSAHYRGNAIDVVPQGNPSTWDRVIAALKAAGYRVVDERTRKSEEWSGPHLHVEMG